MCYGGAQQERHGVPRQAQLATTPTGRSGAQYEVRTGYDISKYVEGDTDGHSRMCPAIVAYCRSSSRSVADQLRKVTLMYAAHFAAGLAVKGCARHLYQGSTEERRPRQFGCCERNHSAWAAFYFLNASARPGNPVILQLPEAAGGISFHSTRRPCSRRMSLLQLLLISASLCEAKNRILAPASSVCSRICAFAANA
jgi:hypothetical protein